MDDILHFEDLSKGDRWSSPQETITRESVLAFANLTGDNDPLHVDEQYAKQSPYREPIAHGLLGLSLMAGLSSNHPRVQTIAFTEVADWQFKRPIYFGDQVHALTEVVELQRHGARSGKVTWFRKLINQDGIVVQQGTLETIVAMRKAARRAMAHAGSSESSRRIEAT